MISLHRRCAIVRIEINASKSDERNQQSRKPTIDCARGKRSYRESFDMLIKGRMVVFKSLVVGQITRSSPIQHCTNQARPAATDTTRRLDRFRSTLWLA